jgi:hypothetical protein
MGTVPSRSSPIMKLNRHEEYDKNDPQITKLMDLLRKSHNIYHIRRDIDENSYKIILNE